MKERSIDLLYFGATIILQYILSMMLVFMFSFSFPGIDTHTRAGWLAVIASIWIGDTLGVCAGGFIMRRLRRQPLRLGVSIWLTAAAVGLPLLILVLLSWRFDPTLQEPGFKMFVMDWQYYFPQISLLTGMIGFYVAGWKR